MEGILNEALRKEIAELKSRQLAVFRRQLESHWGSGLSDAELDRRVELLAHLRGIGPVWAKKKGEKEWREFRHFIDLCSPGAKARLLSLEGEIEIVDPETHDFESRSDRLLRAAFSKMRFLEKRIEENQRKHQKLLEELQAVQNMVNKAQTERRKELRSQRFGRYMKGGE